MTRTSFSRRGSSDEGARGIQGDAVAIRGPDSLLLTCEYEALELTARAGLGHRGAVTGVRDGASTDGGS